MPRLGEIFAANFAILVGSVLQATVGAGGGLLIVPVVAFINEGFLPAPLMFASCLLWIAMAFGSDSEIDFVYMGTLLFGIAAGAGYAIFIGSPPAAASLSFWIGALTLISVLATFLQGNIKKTPFKMFGAGVLFGFTGTVAGLGAPFIPLLYEQNDPGRFRRTLGVVYTAGCAMILVAMSVRGQLGLTEINIGFHLIPGFIAGFLISLLLTKIVNAAIIRIAVLSAATVSAIVLMLRGGLL